jgi:glycosyltransferase involved in cell wall biosynthesis
VATYNRNLLLEKLLTSIKNQKLDNDIELEVVVVDNHPEGKAQNVISSFQNSNGIITKYFIQPVKNISLTRNKAVMESTGEYLAFIDDDEFSDNNWIVYLYKTLIEFQADGVFGRVLSYFPSGTPDWIQECFVYNREAPETGSVAASKRTGNCLIKTSLLKVLDEPFNSAYGLTGGEDAMLFDRLATEGAKFVNCKEAITYEFVPEDRTRLSWLISRAFAMGNGYTRRMIQLKPRSAGFALMQFATGILYSIVSFVLCIVQLFDRKRRLHWFLKTFSNLGKVSASLGIFPKRYS